MVSLAEPPVALVGKPFPRRPRDPDSAVEKYWKLSFFGSIQYFMSSLASKLSATGLADRIFDERKLAEVLGGSDARRYGLVSRALKDGSLIRIKRGTYALAGNYQNELIHPFAVAQAFVPGSYVSAESALAHHGWIPEAVFVTASVTPGRKSLDYETANFGSFRFHPLAIREYQFLTSVERTKMGKLTGFVARPLRAIMDLVALRKERWMGLEWLTESLRIDEEHLLGLRPMDFEVVRHVYKHKAVNTFLRNLEAAVRNGRAAPDGKGDSA